MTPCWCDCHVDLLVVFYTDNLSPWIYTLSLHDALPICGDDRSGFEVEPAGARLRAGHARVRRQRRVCQQLPGRKGVDRKSTRLNSSHLGISYAVFCLKKKNKIASERSTITQWRPSWAAL